MTVKDIMNSRSWLFLFWMTAALLAYRTAPSAGLPLWISVVNGLIYLVCWILLIRTDAQAGGTFSPLMGFQLVLIFLSAVTLIAERGGETSGIVVRLALLWMIPVGLPLQGLVRVFAEAASLSDIAMAAVSIALLAVLLIIRMLWYAVSAHGGSKKST